MNCLVRFCYTYDEEDGSLTEGGATERIKIRIEAVPANLYSYRRADSLCCPADEVYF